MADVPRLRNRQLFSRNGVPATCQQILAKMFVGYYIIQCSIPTVHGRSARKFRYSRRVVTVSGLNTCQRTRPRRANQSTTTGYSADKLGLLHILNGEATACGVDGVAIASGWSFYAA